MGSKLILLLSLLVGALLTFVCTNKDKDALLLKYKDIGKSETPVAVIPTEATPSIPIEPITKEIVQEEVIEKQVKEPEPVAPELATPIFSYTVGEQTKLSAKLSIKDKTEAMEEFILKYCPAESCTQDLSFEDETKEASWKADAIKIAAFLKDKNVKDGVLSIGGNLFNIEGELENDTDMDELNGLLKAFDPETFKMENLTKVAPIKEEAKKEESKPTEKSLKDVEQEIADLLKVHPVLFEFNSINITKESKDVLNTVIATLKKYPKVELTVEGHTDAKGKAAYNKRLSQKRANAVKKYLQKSLENEIKAIGYGETKPISSNPREKINRRVEIHLKEGE